MAYGDCHRIVIVGQRPWQEYALFTSSTWWHPLGTRPCLPARRPEGCNHRAGLSTRAQTLRLKNLEDELGEWYPT